MSASKAIDDVIEYPEMVMSQLIFFRGGLASTKCHVVAQTEGYHLVCIWVGLVKFKGGGFVLKFDVFQHCYAVFVLFASPACKQ